MGAVVGTGLLKFVFVDLLEFRVVFIVLAALFWTFFLGLLTKRQPNLLTSIGFGSKGLKPTLRATTLLFSSAVLVFLLYAKYSGQFFINHHIVYTLVLYPIWGLIQQTLVMGLFARNLYKTKLPIATVVMATALTFSLVHLPDLWLTIGTFALGVFYTTIYLKYRNLWPLGIYHGWIASFFYFLVLKVDPWSRLFEPTNI